MYSLVDLLLPVTVFMDQQYGIDFFYLKTKRQLVIYCRLAKLIKILFRVATSKCLVEFIQEQCSRS